ncbi:hypothetical protein AGMMS50284_7940 [Clostridia bacterium]|nr:hypothetical protein AGMMS50284_7940 [Clostridia bacterium]
MSNEEKKEKIGTIKEKIDIDFPSSMQILEINVNITQNKFYTIDAVFKVSKEEINAIYKQLNEEMQLYKWHKWLKNEPYFPKIWLELVEGREDYDFFDKAVPNSGKGANQMFFLVVPSEVDTSYTIYISYFGE